MKSSGSAVIVLAVCAICFPALGQQSGTVLAEIASKGAAAEIRELNAGGGARWKVVVHRIEQGTPAWLDVAKKLLGASDAGRTSDLYFALSLALMRNPSGVLSMTGPELPLAKVCSPPYIEPDEKTVNTYRSRARAALAKVNSPALAVQKKDCLASIDRK